MTLIERINYYAKGVVAAVGAVAVFGTVVVNVTGDGSVDGGDLSTLIVAGITLIATVVGVIKKTNIDPSGGI